MRKISFIEQMILAEWKADIVCLCETWLQPNSTTNRFLDVSDYLSFRCDRQPGFHGGLLVYVNPRLCPNRRFDLEAAGSEEEFVALDLKIPSLGNCLPFHCYRSPSFSPNIFFNVCGPRGAVVSVIAFNAEGREFKSTHGCSHTMQKPSISPRLFGQCMLNIYLPFTIKYFIIYRSALTCSEKQLQLVRGLS